MSSIGNITRTTLHISKVVPPPTYALLADLRPPIDGEVRACLTLILNTKGIIPIPDELNTIMVGTRDLCETKRRAMFADIPCASCRIRFHIREVHAGHRA